MSPKRVQPPHLKLEVVFDTNALYTGSAHYFLKKEVGDLIERNSNPSDLTIRWTVPEIVRHERQFQMMQVAFQMLPTIEKLERLLGNNLNITEGILETRVKEAVDRQIQRFSLVVQPLNSTDVNWQRVILDAAYRKAPFQFGETEKGFRDALILETFVQIVASSPTGRSVARLAFVSGDQILRNATQSRLGGATNVHLLESVDALKGLINTLSSTVDEEFIAAIRPRAAEVFFKLSDKKTLYYKASVRDALEKTLKAANVKLPTGADKYEIENWTISPPQFVKKETQRIHWTTRFEAKLKALKSAATLEWARSGSSVPLSSLIPGNAADGAAAPSYSSSALMTAATRGFWQSPKVHFQASPPSVSFATSPTVSLASTPTSIFAPTFAGTVDDQFVGSGAATLDASWSLAVTTSGTLTKPRLESVAFVEVVWGLGG
jgi:hypothetical protein